MSLDSPPGTGRALPQLLAFVLDDEDRTRRARILLGYLTGLLLAVVATVVAVLLLAHHLSGSLYTGAGAGSIIAILLRRRQREE